MFGFDTENHRILAPDAVLSPNLSAMITYQLQQRVVQEAELLFVRSSSGALNDSSTHGQSATLTDCDIGSARKWNNKLVHVPHYCMNRLMPDGALRADLRGWIQRNCSKGHGWTDNNGIVQLQQHRHTTAMAIALWRLATWIDSMASTNVL